MRSGHADGVAVIIAAFRCGGTVQRAVRSALAEPDVVEVCVVDDASGDDTADRAAAADDGTGRLKVLRQPHNQGPSAARNLAIATTRAPWICVLDADDYFLPGRTARLLEHAANGDLVADELLHVAEGEIPAFRPSGAPAQIINLATFVERNVSRPNVHRQELGYAKPLMRRAFLNAHDLRYRTDMRLGEDYELYARALAHGGRMLLLPALGYVSTDREGSLSKVHGAAELRALRDCDDDLSRIRRLSAAERRAFRAHYHALDGKLQWLHLIEAVKARNLATALGAFARSPAVCAFLLARLGEQAVLRSARAVGRIRSSRTS